MSALINPEKNKDEEDCSMEEERVKQLRGRGNRKNRGNKKLVLHPSIQKATEQDEKEEVTAEQEEKEEEVTAEQENKEEVTAKQEEKEEEVIAEQEDKEEVTAEQEDKEEVTAEQEEKEEEVTAEQEKWNVCKEWAFMKMNGRGEGTTFAELNSTEYLYLEEPHPEMANLIITYKGQSWTYRYEIVSNYNGSIQKRVQFYNLVFYRQLLDMGYKVSSVTREQNTENYMYQFNRERKFNFCSKCKKLRFKDGLPSLL